VTHVKTYSAQQIFMRQRQKLHSAFWQPNFHYSQRHKSKSDRQFVSLLQLLPAISAVCRTTLMNWWITKTTRDHWIQRITFAAETNAACSRGSADTHTHIHRRRALQYLLRSPSGGEGNDDDDDHDDYDDDDDDDDNDDDDKAREMLFRTNQDRNRQASYTRRSRYWCSASKLSYDVTACRTLTAGTEDRTRTYICVFY